MLKRLIWLAVLVVGCGGSPAQPPASVPPGSSPVPSTVSSASPLPQITTRPRTTPTQADDEESWLGGTITWTANTSEPVADTIHTQSISGTANVVIHVIDPYLLLAERDTGNTYRYDYTNNYDCPSSHEEGTLESQVGVGTTDFWDFSIATLNPAGPTGEDLHLSIHMPDYCGPSLGADAGRVPDYDGFPDCEPLGDQLYGRFDGVNYVIDCDVISFSGVSRDTGTVSGHVSGTLSPIAAPL